MNRQKSAPSMPQRPDTQLRPGNVVELTRRLDAAAGDPLIPTFQRFPVNLGIRPMSDEVPSVVRPFILRGVVARRIQTAREAVQGKHRTDAHNTLHARTCNEDGKMIDDSYTTPDD